MGFGKKKRQIRDSIEKWSCNGFFGYGQGRAVAEYGQKLMSGRSACLDICTRASACRAQHHQMMNERWPQLGQLVESAARVAELRKLDVVKAVVDAMDQAVDLQMNEALEVKAILGKFKIDTMTDHYRCGQFQNIQDGLDKAKPGTGSAPKLHIGGSNGSLVSSSPAAE